MLVLIYNCHIVKKNEIGDESYTIQFEEKNGLNSFVSTHHSSFPIATCKIHKRNLKNNQLTHESKLSTLNSYIDSHATNCQQFLFFLLFVFFLSNMHSMSSWPSRAQTCNLISHIYVIRKKIILKFYIMLNSLNLRNLRCKL